MSNLTPEKMEIEWMKLMEARSWDKYWILKGENVKTLLWERGIEIWKTYEVRWPYGKMRITINWISDDRFWFDENTPDRELFDINERRAAVWGTTEGEIWVWFIWYVRDFSRRPSGAKWSMTQIHGKNIIFHEYWYTRNWRGSEWYWKTSTPYTLKKSAFADFFIQTYFYTLHTLLLPTPLQE